MSTQGPPPHRRRQGGKLGHWYRVTGIAGGDRAAPEDAPGLKIRHGPALWGRARPWSPRGPSGVGSRYDERPTACLRLPGGAGGRAKTGDPLSPHPERCPQATRQARVWGPAHLLLPLLEQPPAAWLLAWECPVPAWCPGWGGQGEPGLARSSFWSRDSDLCPEAIYHPLPASASGRPVGGAEPGISWGAGDTQEGLALGGLPPPTCERRLSIVRPLLGKLVSSKLLAPFGCRHCPALSGHPSPPSRRPGKLAQRGAGTPRPCGRSSQPSSVQASQLLGRRKALGSAGDT